MKRILAILVTTILLSTGRTLAQSKDTVPAKKIIEQGTKGDIILGNKNKEKQLSTYPSLQQKDSLQRSTKAKKKCRNKTKN